MTGGGQLELGEVRLEGDHEEVGGIYRARSGLRAIVAIHSTALGPALGGTRFRPYDSLGEALSDVLRLSRAMSYKSAMAGLALGGGKAVILGDPASVRTSELMRDYAAFLDSFGGRYYTAEDVGTTQADMDELGRHTEFVAGRSVEVGGSGDPSPVTAYGVYRAMQATAAHLWGSDSLSGRTVALSGVGKVGGALAELLAADGAKLVVADVDAEAVERCVKELSAVAVETDEIHRSRCDVYAPCALGGALNDVTVPELECEAVVGAANNQLDRPELAEVLAGRGIAYVPDYVVNAGGVINIAYERGGYDAEAARLHVGRIYETVVELFEKASATGATLVSVADATAEARMAAARSDKGAGSGD